MGTMIPQENVTKFLGNGEFPQTRVLKKGEPKKGMHNLGGGGTGCVSGGGGMLDLVNERNSAWSSMMYDPSREGLCT